MIDFETFVADVVTKWRTERNTVLEHCGLANNAEEPSNRELGDAAEEYVCRKIDALTPNYRNFRSPGSQSPADIFAVARRGGYWHIMLIQVKSSDAVGNLARLTTNDQEVFAEFVKFVRSELLESTILERYKNSSILISTGYAGVVRIEISGGHRHRLASTEMFRIYKHNYKEKIDDGVRRAIQVAHELK